MRIVSQTPVLEAETRRGNKKFWVGYVMEENGRVGTCSEYWQETVDGGISAKQMSAVRFVKGKNIGKSNETTDEGQALFNLNSIVTSQKDAGYHEEGEEAHILTLPMLAGKYKDRIDKIQFPCFVQPKLDGIRCLSDGKRAWSRGGKDLIPEVVSVVMTETDGYVLDGELVLPLELPKDRVQVEIEEGHLSYTPKEWGFQDTLKAVKKIRPESAYLEHQVYDIAVEGIPFSERYEILRGIVEKSSARVVLVQTVEVNSHDEILEWHAEFVAQGYEGSIIRERPGEYIIGHRSNALLKHKDFCDAEFVITDVVEGEAGETGCAIFVCVTPEGRAFNVRPKGEVSARKDMFNKRSEYIQKELTVSYQNLTEDGIPRFPVGINVRDVSIQGG